MNFISIIIIAIVGIAVYVLQKESHEKEIYEQVESISGRVISIEQRTLRTGPFPLAGKGRTVYRIMYEVDGEVREGWVKFGGFLGSDWRL